MSRDGFCSKILAGPMVMVALLANLAIVSGRNDRVGLALEQYGFR